MSQVATKIIGAAIGRGAQDPRTEYGPDKLREADLIGQLQAAGMDIAWSNTIYPHYGRKQVEPIPLVAEFSARLMNSVAQTIDSGIFPVVLGGDHSCAIGTWSGVHQAVRQRGDLGLIWIDAHMDSHTPRTTESGAVHGMPLACLLGFGEPSLVALGGVAPKLKPGNVCLIGVRSFESGESELLKQLGVRVFYADEVKERGFKAILQEGIELVQKAASGFGISLDLDVIDPSDAPGVGSPAKGGISAQEAVAGLRLVRGSPNLLALELTEYNPFLDREQRTARLALDLIRSVLGRG